MAQIDVGDTAPEFSTVDDQNQAVKLSDLKGNRVVLYFYPKDDTPGCTRQACGFRDIYSGLEELNSVVLGVSPDGVESHQEFKSKFSLPFPLLVDQDHAIAEAYGTWVEPEQQPSHWTSLPGWQHWCRNRGSTSPASTGSLLPTANIARG
jgi:peroxiredoxin Q/BCP